MNTGAQMRTRVQAQPWLLHRGDFAVCASNTAAVAKSGSAAATSKPRLAEIDLDRCNPIHANNLAPETAE
ncbi:MAG: hypothetical protein N838_35805 [Thiohalocapsa sp. PB-PSB1]|nr:MAG: hypothetical protein N838_35805 [Thiohalocapsa sp. PB-PSB1]